MLTVGKRNLVDQIARSRMARDVRTTGRYLGAAWALAALIVGTWVMLMTLAEWLGLKGGM